MNDYTYVAPSDAEMRAIFARAQRMRAETTRAGAVAIWGWLRSLFVKSGSRTAGAH